MMRGEVEQLLQEGETLVRMRASEGDVVFRAEDGLDRFVAARDDLIEGIDFHRGQGFVEQTMDLPPMDTGELTKLRDAFEKELIEEFNVPGLADETESALSLPDPRGTARLYGNQGQAERALASMRTLHDLVRGRIKPGAFWDEALRAFDTKWNAPLGQRLLRAAFPEMSAAELRNGAHRGFLPGSKRPKGRRLTKDTDALYERAVRMMDEAKADPELRPHAWDIPERGFFDRVDELDLVDASLDTSRPYQVDALRGTVAAPTTHARALRPELPGGENQLTTFLRALSGERKAKAALGEAGQGALGVVDRMFRKLEEHGHGPWFRHVGEGFFRQVLRKAGRADREEYERALEIVNAAWRNGGGERSRLGAAAAAIEKIAGQKNSPIQVAGTGAELVGNYARAWSNAIFQQRLVDRLARARTLTGAPILISKAKRKRVIGSVATTDTGASQLFKDYVEPSSRALEGFMVHKDFPLIDQVFGPQSLRAAIEDTNNPFFRTLQRANLHMKGALLSFSGFHMVALGQSLMAGNLLGGTRVLAGAVGQIPGLGNTQLGGALRSWASEVQGLPEGIRGGAFLDIFGEAGEVYEQAVRSGLQLDTFQRIAEEGFVELVSDLERGVEEAQRGARPGEHVVGQGPAGAFKVLRSPLTGAVNINKALNHGTWEIVHNSGKVQLYAMHLDELMRAFPEASMQQLQRQAAETTNAQMGGLNWRRVFGDAKVRQGLQLMLLAPDWTFANLIVARDLLVGFDPGSVRKDAQGRFSPLFRDMVAPNAASHLARKYWINHAISLFAAKQAMSYAINGHSTIENPGNKSKDKLNVMVGKDGETGAPLFLHTGKQFGEPFELVFDNGAQLVMRKASPILQSASQVVMNRRHAGLGAEQITVPSDSSAVGFLKTIGYSASDAVMPIPFSQAGRAVQKAIEGSPDANREALNIILGSVDLPIRRHFQDTKEGKVKKPSKVMQQRFPSALHSELVPDWQSRMLEIK